MPGGMQSAKRLRAVLVGAGSLGRAFLRRLRDDPSPVELVGLLTAHHGYRIESEGIDPAVALNLAESGDIGRVGPSEFADQLVEAKADVLVECIPQNIRSGEPALGYHRTALSSGVHVVTSNKSPIALGYRDLLHRAAKAQLRFRFEATVLDGLGVFSFVSTLKGHRIVKIRSVLNATSSVVLESVSNGGSRSRGLARAQAQGIAEADPVLDLDGWDAAAKSALLANVWMEGSLRVVDVTRTGLETIKDSEIERAARENLRYKLVSKIERDDNEVIASVEPVALEPDDPFWALQGPQGAVEIETDLGHRFGLYQKSAGLSDAAGALLSDCWALIAQDPQT